MTERKNDLSDGDLERINSLIYIFMWQLQANQKQQHSELVNAFSTLVSYLGEMKGYQNQINELKYKPLMFFIRQRPQVFTPEEIKNLDLSYNLCELDFIYFRDTSMSFKLKKTYRSTHVSKRRFNKMINLSQIIILLQFVREWVFGEFLLVTKKHNLAIPQIQLPQTKQHNLEGVGIDARNA